MRHGNVRLAILAGLTAALVAMAPVAAQTPSPATPVSTAPASPTPTLPPQTSVPGHPLQVVFGPHPAGTTSYGEPVTEGSPTYSDVTAVRREFGNLVTTAVPGFTLTSLTATGVRDRFTSGAVLLDDAGRRFLKIGTWTKAGPFVMVVPANSPVSVVRQTTLDGFAALTIMPSAAVVGGVGPRTVVLTDGKYIWSMDLEGFTDDNGATELALAIVGRALEPGSPATGNGAARPPGATMAPALLGIGAFLAAIVLLAVAKRRWSNSSR
jgi:hypothetical protein